jgi:hypothetical protein
MEELVIRTCSCQTTMVCVDSWEHNRLTGRIHTPRLPGDLAFCGVLDLLNKLEDLMEGLAVPGSDSAERTFLPPPGLSQIPPGSSEGAVATFAIRILFCQNTSWQGTVTWMEARREGSFRSVLELLLMLSSALTEQPKG